MQKQMPRKLYILVPDKPAQIQNESAIAAKTISSVIRTCLGPRAMQKMVLTKINSIELTNDGNAILRELDVAHPSARSLIELAKTQDDEVGDGTTSVVILAAEILGEMRNVLDKNIHPIKICKALSKALEICIKTIESASLSLDTSNDSTRLMIIRGSVATKVCGVLKIPIEELALETVKKVYSKEDNKCDLKTNMKVEKILGGNFLESEVLDGVLINKEIIHPQMHRKIENPRIVMIESPLEYKKGESQTNYEFSKEDAFTKALEVEEEQVREMCREILAVNPDIVVCEKGVSDLALSILFENNITGLRRMKKTDMSRLSKVCGARIVNRAEDLDEKHVGTLCGSFEYVKHGEEYYCKFSKCANPKACSVIIRGPTKDILNELERNFMDAVKVAKNIFVSPKLCPGGGAMEMAMARALKESIGKDEAETEVFSRMASALAVIPSILLENSGVFNPMEAITVLEQKQKEGSFYGIDGISGEVVDTRSIVLEPYAVKSQCIKSAVEAVSQLLRIDGIIESKH
ncbi:subunit gamma of T-complex protein 1 [Ordospora colligata]|uniref:T-complex protein 1 subunit gamma n=1 Tax=Ordospora colligata OC4 TaxID=1354746 RepID=A0A0B2UEV2_9MICR|nr:subunit gamma of T-complex protein 1 [Ordospora colligata OC4]KHN69611.1 subunit gamma of T-complex protein 1 [Ordospora colligata OC4]TBU15730.1 subunit gamma of T-complex protein 1 [Ordospora colligata]TBU15858.1 subunit gamma of T-complex protein 1 [Ordospora colligata]TBU18752.1 subunit gamma of T-complex protein 1 [Ordospora colligata]